MLLSSHFSMFARSHVAAGSCLIESSVHDAQSHAAGLASRLFVSVLVFLAGTLGRKRMAREKSCRSQDRRFYSETLSLYTIIILPQAIARESARNLQLWMVPCSPREARPHLLGKGLMLERSGNIVVSCRQSLGLGLQASLQNWILGIFRDRDGLGPIHFDGSITQSCPRYFSGSLNMHRKQCLHLFQDNHESDPNKILTGHQEGSHFWC